jgi:hypothetical protein
VWHGGEPIGELGVVTEECPRDGRHVRAQFCGATFRAWTFAG